MLVEHRGKCPRVAESAYIAPTAVVCGDVVIGEDCRILFGAVITAEGGHVELGDSTIVMENALIRGRDAHPTTVGPHVLIGPHAHVNGATLEEEVFLATGASVFPGAHVGRGTEVRINAVVHANTIVAAERLVPIGWIAVGDPAQLFPPERHDELDPVLQDRDFDGTVWGVTADHASMRQVTQRYADLFAHHHDDRMIDDPGQPS